MPSPTADFIATLDFAAIEARIVDRYPLVARNMRTALAYGAGAISMARMFPWAVPPIHRKPKRPRRWRQLELFDLPRRGLVLGVPQGVTQRARRAPTCAPRVPVSLNEINHLAP